METYLFDFAEDLYGRAMELQYIQYLRPEQNSIRFPPCKRDDSPRVENAKQALKEARREAEI